MDRQGVQNAGELAGRVLLGLLFVLEAYSKVAGYGATGRYMVAYGIPAQLLPAAIAFELGAGLLVMAGWHTRLAALALAAFCLVTAFVFHTRFGNRNEVLHFEKDIALAGAFLILWARGASALSVDAWLQWRRATSQEFPAPIAPRRG